MKNKNLSLRILSVLCCCILATNVCWADLPGRGTKEEPYLISSYEDLMLMATWSNKGISESGIKYNEAYYKLKNDIVFFEGESLTKNEDINSNVSSLIQSHICIGTKDYPFNGTFDGNGMTLKKVYYESNSVPYVGLFGIIGENAVIQNVKIEDSYFYGNAFVGGICGYNNGGKIIGCSFSGVVNNDCKGFSTLIALGGICGYNCGTIEKCINSGYVNPSKNEVECGGICGNNRGSISICSNSGTIYYNYNNTGGICGNNNNNSADKINNCSNFGEIKIEYTKERTYVGGICGNGDCNYCFNCTVISDMRAVNNNIGPISGNYTSSQKLQNYYIEKSPSYKKEQNNQEYSQVKTKADITSGLVAYLLNQGNNQSLWRQTIGSNYPVLLNGKEVYGYNDGELITNTELFWDKKGFLTYNSKIYNQKPKLEKDIYQIANTGNLYWFANYVNKGGDCANADAVLVNNIEDNSNVINEKGELNSENFKTWAVIGNKNSMGQTVYYKGTFDGQGHTISGLYINSGNYCGLFGNNQGTIQNVGVINSYFYIPFSSGGICTNNNGTIQNCFNTSTVKAENKAAGICYNNTSDGKIINCYNSGLVKLSSESNKEFDGICVSNEGAITNCYNNSDFTKSTCEGVTNYITPDICNGKLFEGFDEDIWVAGKNELNSKGGVIFTLPYLKNGDKLQIIGKITYQKEDKTYYFDSFTKENMKSIKLTYLDVTKEDKDNLTIFYITEINGKNTLVCQYYGINFGIIISNYKNYAKTEFVWNTTSSPATAQIKLFTDEENFVTKDCDVAEIERTDPTCTTDGSVKYVAQYAKNFTGKYLNTENKTIPLPVLGHKYKAPTFTWTNYTKSVATFVCEKDGDTQNVDGVITSKIEIEPTTEAEGLKVYTATFNFNGDTYTDTKKETLAKLEKPEPNGGDDPTPTNEISQNSQYKVWGYNNNIYIETENIDSQIQIFDINGRLIKSLKSTNTHTEININKGGIFVVVINNNIFKVAM